MINLLDNAGNIVGSVTTPEVLPPTEDFPFPVHLDPVGILNYHKGVAKKLMDDFKDHANQKVSVTLTGTPRTIHITTSTLTMLQLRANAGTAGLWEEFNGTPFQVTAAEYQDMLTAIIAHGDWVYGNYFTYLSNIQAAPDKAAIDAILAQANIDYQTYLAGL